MDEATALFGTLTSTDPGDPTACGEWKAHDLVAHLAAGAAEMADHAERVLVGVPARATAGFSDREAPFVELEDEVLRGRLLTEALRLNSAVEELAQRKLTVLFSGRRMSADDIRMHGRSEASLHRWDLCGDDDVGDELLPRPDLTEHAVKVLNSMLPGSRESPPIRAVAAGIHGPARFAFASPGEVDVLLTIDEQGSRFEVAPEAESPTAVADAATRLLAIWGRRSADRTITWSGDDLATEQFVRFLWGRSATAR